MTDVTDAMLDAGEQAYDAVPEGCGAHRQALLKVYLAMRAVDASEVSRNWLQCEDCGKVHDRRQSCERADAAPGDDAEWLRDLAVSMSDQLQLHTANRLERIASRLATPTPREPDDAMIEALAFAIAPHFQRTTPVNPDCEDVNAGRDYAMLVARNGAKAMLAASPRSDVLREALDEVREYFDQRADAECDPSGPGYTGNEEMRLLVMIDAALASTGKTGGSKRQSRLSPRRAVSLVSSAPFGRTRLRP